MRVEWQEGKMTEVEGSEFTLKADLILLAMGFTGPQAPRPARPGGCRARRARQCGGRARRPYATSVAGRLACGDMRRGQSLVVWAIREGRQAPALWTKALMGETQLPR